MRKIISPIIYMLSAIPVFFLVMFSMSIMEKTFGLHIIWRMGDIDAFIALIFFGIVVFGSTSYFLLRFETVKRPTIADHMRYSSLLYISFIALFIKYMRASVYASLLECQNDCHGHAIWILFILIPLLAIIINGFYLYRKSKGSELKY